MIAIILLLVYLVPVVLMLIVGWFYLPKKSTVKDLIDKFDGLDVLPPIGMVLIPVLNWPVLLLVLTVIIARAVEPKFTKLKNIRIK